MPASLTSDQVRHIARLALLRLDESDIDGYRLQIESILNQLNTISEIDVEGVEPLARPMSTVNRLGIDEPEQPIDASILLDIAPSLQGPLVAVPKVINDGQDEGSA